MVPAGCRLTFLLLCLGPPASVQCLGGSDYRLPWCRARFDQDGCFDVDLVLPVVGDTFRLQPEATSLTSTPMDDLV